MSGTSRLASALRRAALALAALGWLGCGGGGSSAPRPPDLVLLTIDTLRADHLGLYGYARPTSPNIDRWFAEGLLFDNAYATETATSPSVASILSGLHPQRHRVRLFYQLLPDDVPTLADWLRAAGYQTAAVVSNIVLTDEAMGLARRFDRYDDYVDSRDSTGKVWERRARPTTDAALEWLRAERDPERPLFLWVHYIDPHGPYQPPPDRPVDFTHEGSTPVPVPSGRMGAHQMTAGSEDALEYVDLYDEEIAYCDREVGRLLDGLAPHVDPERTVFALTADHGETMMEHESWFTHQYHVYEGMARVPLALRLPASVQGARSGRVDRTVSLVDVAPTLLALARVPVPPGLDGRSLLADAPPRALVEGTGFDGSHQYRSLVRGDDKWIVRIATSSGELVGRWRVRLDSDPGEQTQLEWSGEDERSAALLLQLAADDPDPGGVPRVYERGSMITRPKIRPDLGSEEVEKLRALGYVR